MNSSAIKINFYAWRDGGCPILDFRLAYRRLGDDHWIKVSRNLIWTPSVDVRNQRKGIFTLFNVAIRWVRV